MMDKYEDDATDVEAERNIFDASLRLLFFSPPAPLFRRASLPSLITADSNSKHSHDTE
jgi:hypothetical protein